MILVVENIETFYGISQILFGVSLNVDQGEVVALLGRNGAGKTTTIRSIMGLTPPKKGSVKFRGEEVRGQQVHINARKGLGYVPSERRIYGDLTVRQNLLVAVKKGWGDEIRWTVDKIYDLFPALVKLDSHRGGLLSGGEQQMLAIARTLMGNPDLLLLDEPSTGLAPVVVKALGQQIQRLVDEGHAVLLTEQNAKFAMEVSERCYIIDRGEIKYQGTIKDLRQNQSVMKTYLAV